MQEKEIFLKLANVKAPCMTCVWAGPTEKLCEGCACYRKKPEDVLYYAKPCPEYKEDKEGWDDEDDDEDDDDYIYEEDDD